MTGGPFGLLTGIGTALGLVLAASRVVADASLGAQIFLGVVGVLAAASFVGQFFHDPR